MFLLELKHGGDIYSHEHKNMLDFSANINPLGLPETVKQAITDNIHTYSGYPDPLCRELTLAIAEKEKIQPQQTVCGNGAADIIFRTVLALKPKKALIIQPTFSEYAEALNLVDCEVSSYILEESQGFKLTGDIFNSDLTKPDIIFCCSPNNPTGIPVKKEILLKLAEVSKKNGVILAIDECFNDFLDEPEKYSLVDHINQYPNVIVFKAFTKFYAMAGIRLGYGISSDINLNAKIRATLQPWSVSTVASKCGIAALEDKDYAAVTKRIITENRDYLKKALNNLGLKVYDSQANYIFFRSEITDLDLRLKQENILIRPCKNFISLNENYYRIAVKSRKDNETLINALKKIL